MSRRVPWAVSSKFGWLLSGPVHAITNRDDHVVSNMIIEGVDVNEGTVCNEADLVEAIQHFWDVEAISINEASPGETVDTFPMNIIFDWNQERHSIGLSCKSDIRPLTDAYPMCVGRLY